MKINEGTHPQRDQAASGDQTQRRSGPSHETRVRMFGHPSEGTHPQRDQVRLEHHNKASKGKYSVELVEFTSQHTDRHDEIIIDLQAHLTEEEHKPIGYQEDYLQKIQYLETIKSEDTKQYAEKLVTGLQDRMIAKENGMLDNLVAEFMEANTVYVDVPAPIISTATAKRCVLFAYSHV